MRSHMQSLMRVVIILCCLTLLSSQISVATGSAGPDDAQQLEIFKFDQPEDFESHDHDGPLAVDSQFHESRAFNIADQQCAQLRGSGAARGVTLYNVCHYITSQRGLKVGHLSVPLRAVVALNQDHLEIELDFSSWFSTFSSNGIAGRPAKIGVLIATPRINTNPNFGGAATGVDVRIRFPLKAQVTLKDTLLRLMRLPVPDVLARMNLDQLVLGIEEINVNFSPFAIRIAGFASMFDLQLKMNFFLGTVVRSSAGFHIESQEEAAGLMADKFGFAFDAAVPGASVQRALDNIFGAKDSPNARLGVVRRAFSLFKFISMHVTLASMDISLDQLPSALSWKTSSDGTESDLLDIKNGITLAFRFSFDQSHPNKFVKAMAQRLGSTGFLGSMGIGFNTHFDMSFGFDRLVLNKNVSLAGAKVFFNGDFIPQPTVLVGVQCGVAMNIHGQELILMGQIAIEVTEVMPILEVWMVCTDMMTWTAESAQHDGMWSNPFGIRNLQIGQLRGGIGILAEPPYIGYISLGGHVIVSDPLAKEQPVDINLQMTIGTASPFDTYFYAKVAPVTLGSLFSMFGVKSMPSVLAQSGFPGGMLFTFALKAQELPFEKEKITLPIGIQFAGGFNFLGLNSQARIVLNPSKLLFDIYFAKDAVHWGPFHLSRSKTERSLGPIIDVKGSLLPLHFHAHIAGYLNFANPEYAVSVFAGEVNFQIDGDHVAFNVSSMLFNAVEASINVRLDYTTLKNTKFIWGAKLETSKIKDKLLVALKLMRDAAEAEFKIKFGNAFHAVDISDVCAGVDRCGIVCNPNEVYRSTAEQVQPSDVAWDREETALIELLSQSMSQSEAESALEARQQVRSESEAESGDEVMSESDVSNVAGPTTNPVKKEACSVDVKSTTCKKQCDISDSNVVEAKYNLVTSSGRAINMLIKFFSMIDIDASFTGELGMSSAPHVEVSVAARFVSAHADFRFKFRFEVHLTPAIVASFASEMWHHIKSKLLHAIPGLNLILQEKQLNSISF